MTAAPSSRSPGHARRAPGPAWPGALGAGASQQLAAIAARLRRDQGRMLSGAARGLLGSPWFAAGAGFVIAAAAFIVAPRAELKFPHNYAINVTPCTQHACKPTVPQGVAAAPLSGSNDQIVTASPAPPVVIVGYHVVWQQDGTFLIQVTLASKRAVGDWQLAFTIPGAIIKSVSGANWQRAGSGQVTVSGSTSQYSPTAGDSVSADESGSGSQVHGDIQIAVIGRGSSTTPANCEFNGDPCRFSRTG